MVNLLLDWWFVVCRGTGIDCVNGWTGIMGRGDSKGRCGSQHHCDVSSCRSPLLDFSLFSISHYPL